MPTTEPISGAQEGVDENTIDIGINDLDTKKIYKNDFIKNWNKIINLKKYSKIYVLNCVVLLLLVSLGVITNIVFNTLLDIPSYSSFISSSNLIIAACTILYFALDAIFRENEFQMLLFIAVITSITLAMVINTIYNTVLLVTEYIESGDIKHIIEMSLSLFFNSLVIISQSTFIALAYPIYISFGWKLFKVVGTDRVLIRSFRIYNLWLTILKADVALTIDLSLLNLAFAPSVAVVWLVVVAVFIVVHLVINMILVPIKIFAAKRESKLLFIPCILFWIIWTLWLTGKTIQTIIFVFITGEAYQNPWRILLGERNAGLWSVSIGFSYLYMGGLSIVNIIFRLVEFVLSILVLLNFGKGLKDTFKEVKVKKKVKKEKRGVLKEKLKKQYERHKRKKQRDKARNEMQRKHTVLKLHDKEDVIVPDIFTPELKSGTVFINNEFTDSDDDASEEDNNAFTAEEDLSDNEMSI